MVTHVLVTSMLDYHNMLYMVLPMKMVQNLLLVENFVSHVNWDQWNKVTSLSFNENYTGFHSSYGGGLRCLF